MKIAALVLAFLSLSRAQSAFDPHWLRNLAPSAQVAQSRTLVGGRDSSVAEAAQVVLVEGLLRQGDGASALREAGNFGIRFPGSVFAQRIHLFQAWADLEVGNLPRGVDGLAELLGNSSDPSVVQQARQSLKDLVRADKLDLACAAQLRARLSSEDSLLADLRQIKKPAQAPIFLVLPQNGEVGELGRRAMQGAQIELRRQNQPYVLLEESADPTQTWKLVKSAVELVRPRAIVGPMMSASAAVVAAGLADIVPDVPLVLPTATSPGIAGLAPHAWQLNFTTASQGEAMARYAWNCLDLREAAILAPQGDYGEGVAEGFRRAFVARGGRVFWQQSYPSGRSDFRAQLESLKRTWQQGRHKDDVSPALFVPAETAREVLLMDRQLPDLKPLWLGSSGWHTQSFLKESGGRFDGAYLVTDYAPDERRAEWRNFSKEYKEVFKEIPDRVASLGYDAVRLALVQGLRGETAYAGTQGEIRFDSRERHNTAVPFLKVSRTAFLIQAGDCTHKP
jgi:ABC-type branched-subunit amino acid transport system substrate-binding protein